MGGGDEYANLVLVLEEVHKLIHATNEATIRELMEAIEIDSKSFEKLNKLREKAGNKPINMVSA